MPKFIDFYLLMCYYYMVLCLWFSMKFNKPFVLPPALDCSRG